MHNTEIHRNNTKLTKKKEVGKVQFNFLSTKDNEKIENRKLMYSQYYTDIKNEWYYEDEILNMNRYRIITVEN